MRWIANDLTFQREMARELRRIIEVKCRETLAEIEAEALKRGLAYSLEGPCFCRVAEVLVSVRSMYASETYYREEAGRISVGVEGIWQQESMRRAIRSKSWPEPRGCDRRGLNRRINIAKVLDYVEEVVMCRERLTGTDGDA